MNSLTRLLLLLAVPALAQPAGAQTTGSLAGSVWDSSGGVLPDAELQVTAQATGAERKVVTGKLGIYLVPGLPPGTYRVSVSRAGFRPETREGIELDAGRTVRVDFNLNLGERHERVEVVAEAPLLSPSASDWGGSIQRQKLDSLPLKGRDMFDLVAQYPGANIPANVSRSIFTGPATPVSVNGARPWQNSFRLDGIYINEASGAAPASSTGRQLGIEALAEVHLITSPFSADQGRTAGGVFTAVSLSGDNDFHGSLYEYLRNSATDSRNYFDSPSEPMPPLRKNQFGGLVSGPIRRNQLFFLGNYEAVRETSSITARPLTISSDGRRGILSPGAAPVAIAASVVPFLDLYPLPTGEIYGNGTGEYVTTAVKRVREDYVAGKIDWLISPRLRTSGRYTLSPGTLDTMDDFRLWDLPSRSRYHFIQTDTQFVESAHRIFNFRAGFSRVWNSQEAEPVADAARTLSFLPGRTLGQLKVTGLADLGSSSLPGISSILTRPRRHTLNDYQFNHEGTLILGAHTVRYGAGFDRIQFNQRADVAVNGGYRFSSLRNLLLASSRAGDYMAPGSDTVRGFRQNQVFAFIQDEWRANQALSLTLGVRYETYSTPTEVNGKIGTFRDPLSDPQVTVGGALFRNPSRRNFAPRGAIAWDVFGTGRTVVRAGAGIFFDLISSRDVLVAGNRMPPFFQRAAPANPPFPNLLDAPPGTIVIAPDTLDYYLNQPYTAQFQVRLQQQLGADTVVQAGYTGSRGIHLLSQLNNINTTRPVTMEDGRLYFPSGAPRMNPAFAQISTRRSQFDSNYHALILSAERRFRHGVQFQVKYGWGKSIDDNSLTFTQSDFGSDDGVPTVFDYRANRGRSDFDIRHDFGANFTWRPPAPGAGVARAVLGGWEIDGLLQARSGQPFSAWVGFDRANLRPTNSGQGQRPDFAGAPGGQVILGRVDQWFDPAAFSLPEAGFLGNLGRNTLGGPALISLDTALQKQLWSAERRALRLRVEFYNLANHSNFAIPADPSLWSDANTRLPTAGRITETTTPSRQVQLALRFAF